MKDQTELKIKALAKYLGCDPEDIDEGYEWYREFTTYELGNQEYLVLTDEEADEACKEYIENSVWAFNASFIIDHSDLPYDAWEMVQSYQEDRCESANETILAMIKDFDEFVEDAISADGRGHFLSGYDGKENEITLTITDEEGECDETYYIYRVN